MRPATRGTVVRREDVSGPRPLDAETPEEWARPSARPRARIAPRDGRRLAVRRPARVARSPLTDPPRGPQRPLAGRAAGTTRAQPAVAPAPWRRRRRTGRALAPQHGLGARSRWGTPRRRARGT